MCKPNVCRQLLGLQQNTDLKEFLEQGKVMNTSVIISDFQSHLSSENIYSAWFRYILCLAFKLVCFEMQLLSLNKIFTSFTCFSDICSNF